MNTTKNLLKAFFNYYQEQFKIIICLLPFCILMLVLLPKPAKAQDCQYEFGDGKITYTDKNGEVCEEGILENY